MSETIPEEGVQTLYIRYPNGTVGALTVGDGVSTDLDPDATVITADEYAAYLESLQQASAVMEAEMREAEQEAVSADYAALRAAGVPEATARRLTGYTG